MSRVWLEGRYRLERKDGEDVVVRLGKTEARMMFKLYQQLGFVGVEYEDSRYGAH